MNMSNSNQRFILCLGLPVDDIFIDSFKEEQISDDDSITHNFYEEKSNKTCYPGEIESDNLREGEETTGNFTKRSINSYP